MEIFTKIRRGWKADREWKSSRPAGSILKPMPKASWRSAGRHVTLWPFSKACWGAQCGDYQQNRLLLPWFPASPGGQCMKGSLGLKRVQFGLQPYRGQSSWRGPNRPGTRGNTSPEGAAGSSLVSVALVTTPPSSACNCISAPLKSQGESLSAPHGWERHLACTCELKTQGGGT